MRTPPRGLLPKRIGVHQSGSTPDRALFAEALGRRPQAYGLSVTIWSIRALQALLQRERGVRVSVYTVHRAVQALGYRHRRPRHDRRTARIATRWRRPDTCWTGSKKRTAEP